MTSFIYSLMQRLEEAIREAQNGSVAMNDDEEGEKETTEDNDVEEEEEEEEEGDEGEEERGIKRKRVHDASLVSVPQVQVQGN